MALDVSHREAIQALLVRITLRRGTILRYTTLNLPVVHGGETFHPAPGVRRGPVNTGVDLQIDATWVKVPNVDLTIGALTRSVSHWAKVRAFDGARVDIILYDETRAAAALHSVWEIQGWGFSLSEVEFALESPIARLDTAGPRTKITPECNNALGGPICGVILADYAVASTVSSATIDTVIFGALTPSVPIVAVGYFDGYFDLGTIEFEDGNLAGLVQEIARHEAGAIYTIGPMPEVPGAGSAITLTPGCHLDFLDCRDKFGSAHRTGIADWRRHFRGFPYTPPWEDTVG